MSMFNEKPAMGVTVIIVLLVATAFLMWRNTAGGGSAPETLFYWNLDAGELMRVSVTDEPPANAVLARVYTCGSCTEDQWQVLMIEKMTDEARQVAESQIAVDPDAEAAAPAPQQEAQLQALMGTVIAAPPAAGEQPKWLVKGTPPAVPIEMQFLTLCNGERAKACTP